VTDSQAPPAQLIVFAGLPGSGKTSLARSVADRLAVTFLRIDTFESAVVSTLQPFEDNPVGYVAAEWVAEDQLRSGRSVVVDAVNSVEIARQGWLGLAERTGAELSFVEVICGDPAEHRRRVESRTGDWPGHGVPTWNQVQGQQWEPFRQPRTLIDNVGDPQQHIERILSVIGAPGRPGSLD